MMNGASRSPAYIRRLLPLIQRTCDRRQQFSAPTSGGSASLTSWSSSSANTGDRAEHTASRRPSWSQEWQDLGLGASLVNGNVPLTNLLFVQVGFGVDQHGRSDDATKAAIRAVRNAIEFNSIPGVIEAVPGGRKEMLIQVKLGIPATMNHVDETNSNTPMSCDVLEVAKVFPYGKLLPMEIVVGGLSFPTGRIVEELGDTNDVAVCVAACVSIGYNNGETDRSTTHATYNTMDGY